MESRPDSGPRSEKNSLAFVPEATLNNVKRCNQDRGGCEHVCEDTQTGVNCSCFDGFRVKGSSCIGDLCFICYNWDYCSTMAKERKKSSILRILYLMQYDAVIAMTTDISIEFDHRVFPRIKRYCIVFFFLNLFKEYSFKNIRNK